eukprot:6444007-Prymnesium_polylepis.2
MTPPTERFCTVVPRCSRPAEACILSMFPDGKRPDGSAEKAASARQILYGEHIYIFALPLTTPGTPPRTPVCNLTAPRPETGPGWADGRLRRPCRIPGMWERKGVNLPKQSPNQFR